MKINLNILGLFLVSIFVAGCQFVDGAYLERGPGTYLDVSRASQSTSEVNRYIDYMCQSAGYAPTATPNPSCSGELTPSKYKVLLLAGFTEISAGCRAYIQFLFEERLRERRFKGANTAISAFINGILTIENSPARLFSYLVLSSTQLNAFYDATRIDPLLSMTIENIQKIVSRRQTAFESVATKQTISSRPQLVRLWYEYQWLCTPLSIQTDFNTLASASVDGVDVDFEAQARETISRTITRLKEFDPAKPISHSAKVERRANALGAFEKNVDAQDLKKLQSALCTGNDDILGPRTRHAINEWRKAMSPDTSLTTADLEKGLSLSEGTTLIGSVSCSTLGYKSAYERGVFYDQPRKITDRDTRRLNTESAANAEGADRIEDLAKTLKVNLPPGGTNKLNATMRKAIELKRQQIKIATGKDYPQGDYLDSDLHIMLLKQQRGNDK